MDIGDQWVWLEYVFSTYDFTEKVVGNMAGRDIKLLGWKFREYHK